MADFTPIIEEINAQINTNGTNAITGAILNSVLRDMISAINQAKDDMVANGSLFGGWILSPGSEPTYGEDTRYFYYATQGGTYVHFNDIVLDENSISVLFWDDNLESWSYFYLTLSANGIANELNKKVSNDCLYSSLGFPIFDKSNSYKKDDYAVYSDGKLYKFLQAHNAGDWNPSDVTETTLFAIIANI